jgi:electron transport complex protein RnfB
MWIGVLVLGAALVMVPRRLPLAGRDDDVERLNALLPQTQCGQCGYPGCRPYAAAILAGEARINQCPPGGEATIRALAAATGDQPLPPDAGFGTAPPPSVAIIDEDACIGCFRCVEVCPVDAIIGAPRYMHTVIAADCTGCELCIPACPVDCIELVAASRAQPAW